MLARIREQIDCVFDRDPAVRSRWEVVTLYPGFHAILLHWLAHWFWQKNFKWLGRATSQFSRFLTGIEIHPGATLGRRVFIDHGMGIVIGETAEVGDDCTLYQGVTLGGTSWNKGKRHPTLAQGVIVGAGAKVIGPIILGEGSKVGSNAVVVKPVPPGATVIGIPGRLLEDEKHQTLKSAPKFTAYGSSTDDKDPLAVTVMELVRQNELRDQQIEELLRRIETLTKTDSTASGEQP
ncbi:MAG: serine O-acetyltransferase [Ferrovum sp.]|nr:serine O-acetyltransferase [Ferrovum sp.]NDU87224.1 serine O-acetyltransferase [Ferrovum sp.]